MPAELLDVPVGPAGVHERFETRHRTPPPRFAIHIVSITWVGVGDDVADRTRDGIGRATLYKYFPDIEAILAAWHERQVHDHLQQLELVRDQASSAGRRLEAVLQAYALMSRGHDATALAALLHRSEHVTHARHQLAGLLQTLIAEGATAGDLRADVPPHELAAYCLHALTAADSLRSKAAIERLVAVVLAGLHRPT